MRQEVTKGRLPSELLGRQQQVRQVALDWVVPSEPASVHQDRGGGCGERLGERGRIEDRVGIHQARLSQFPPTIALGHHHGIVAHHCETDAGDLPVHQHLGDVAVELGREALVERRPILGRDGTGSQQQHRTRRADRYCQIIDITTQMKQGRHGNIRSGWGGERGAAGGEPHRHVAIVPAGPQPLGHPGAAQGREVADRL